MVGSDVVLPIIGVLVQNYKTTLPTFTTMLSRLSLSRRLPRQVRACARFQSSTRTSAVEDSQSNAAIKEPVSLIDRSEKSIFQRFFDRHSITKQTNRILVAESFLQAATKQASDP
jgi:hypothetical protein